jgi:hypothetical protein
MKKIYSFGGMYERTDERSNVATTCWCFSMVVDLERSTY